MKNLIALLIILLLSSCVSTKYNIDQNKGNFDQVQAGTKYAVYDLNNRKTVMDVTSIEDDKIIGINKKETISIAKKDIKEVKKIKTTGTIVLATIGVAVLTTAIVLIDYAKGTKSSSSPKNIEATP